MEPSLRPLQMNFRSRWPKPSSTKTPSPYQLRSHVLAWDLELIPASSTCCVRIKLYWPSSSCACPSSQWGSISPRFAIMRGFIFLTGGLELMPRAASSNWWQYTCARELLTIMPERLDRLLQVLLQLLDLLLLFRHSQLQFFDLSIHVP